MEDLILGINSGFCIGPYNKYFYKTNIIQYYSLNNNKFHYLY